MKTLPYFPVENLDPIAAPVAEYIQLLREGIELQGILDQYSQTVDAFAEVDRIPAQIDCR